MQINKKISETKLCIYSIALTRASPTSTAMAASAFA